MMADAPQELRPAFNGAAIPDDLKALPRWAPWRATFNAKRGKFDKIPHRADVPEYRLSTANPDRWFTFRAAVSTYEREAPSFAGVGYVMTRPHGIVGVDLDDCVHDGHVADWAQEIVDALASYTEVSPSGKGLRIFARGEASDWTNHTVGVEVYGGAEPRFLTLTGQHLPGAPVALAAAPAGVLEGLRAQYGRDAERTEAPAVEMPELLDDFLLPALADLELPYAARDFLLEGDTRGDRSRELHAAAVALYQCGLSDDEVLSLLAASPHAMEVALDHRRQDPDRALLYLWREHCIKAKPKGELRRTATADDFDDVSGTDVAAGTPGAGTAHEAMAKLGKPLRFQFQTLDEFEQGKPLSWIVKRILPQAELGAIYGPSGSGKSFFVLDLVYAITRGVEWRGRKVRQCGVGYVCAEGASGFRLRTRAYREYHGVDVVPAGLRILDGGPNFMERQDIRDLVAALRALPEMPELLVVDTLAQVTPGANENSAEDMGRALAHCKALQRATGAMVLLVAHTGKDESKGMRGSSVIRGALDVEISVARAGEYRAATITKMKDGQGEGDEHPFRLESVTLGIDEDGDAITTAVALPAAAVPVENRRNEGKGEHQQLVLRVAKALAALDDVVTESEIVEAAAEQLVVTGKSDNRRRDVKRALNSLIDGNWLANDNGRIRVL
ncbi:AAA family ATPase [Paracidovorax citrulli]|uniref:AAA family ATPase n=1 Tax=Paracidovorax citrulli TaxID=80869 RepID=UPI000696FE35|nr:AAA family ATPase [Paracidovorax citrulli]UMT88365.1 AAA family ATPase [Paracidovorax citrulli]WIY32726.1 AAA family ATPase [Paracidovorax citrulli]SDJ31603.1 AAA domain-containing protein [Paracidovorax citrulli]